MKNIHLIPTEKESRLYKDDNQVLTLNTHSVLKGIFTNGIGSNQHIYITSEEDIKEGIDQWYLDKVLNEPYNSGGAQYSSKQDVIILTTDTQLIADGVQAIDDEFLEWLVKNPSCEWVEVKSKMNHPRAVFGYEIIFQKEEIKVFSESGSQLFFDEKGRLIKEEPKQETVEEAAKKNCESITYPYCDKEKAMFIKGAKWQQEQDKNKFSKEEVIAFVKWMYDYKADINKVEEWFEQFKKNNYETDSSGVFSRAIYYNCFL
jgi:hypothetical protein